MPSALGLRDQKKLETHAAIARAALDLVTARGYHQVTIADIADAARVSRRTFSNYFASKADCVIQGCAAEGQELLPAILMSDPQQSLKARISKAFLDLPDQFWSDSATLLRLRRQEPEVLAAAARADNEGISALVAELRNLTDDQIDPLQVKVTVAAVVAAMNACLEHWIDDGSPGGTQRLAGLIDQTLQVVDLSWLEQYSELARANLARQQES